METFITRAARLNKAYDIELIERKLECGEDDIIVKNHMMGICGSDKSFYRGFMPPQTAEFRQPPEFPFLLGHESGGTVVAVGSRVSDYKVGDKVMAFGWNNNFADYFKSKAFQLQPVPEGLDMDIAALGEPTCCAMYSGLNTGVQLGDTVVVMGGGYAGQIETFILLELHIGKKFLRCFSDKQQRYKKDLINRTFSSPIVAKRDRAGVISGRERRAGSTNPVRRPNRRRHGRPAVRRPTYRSRVRVWFPA